MKKNIKNRLINRFLSFAVLGAVFLGNMAFATAVHAQEAPSTVKVTIAKYVGGVMATNLSANNAGFQMSATWNAENISAGTGQYTLGPSGSPEAYKAVTTDMSSGADYTTNEIMDSTVGASCAAATPFTLVGYTTGNTMAEAAAATPTMTVPAFTNLTNDKFVIVWNNDCTVVVPPAETVKVQINKYVDGVQATGASADALAFVMSATWASTSHGSGTGAYELDANGYEADTTPYQASTVEFNSGADYSTSETIDGTVVGASCAAATPFTLVGYTTGNTMAEAAAATPTMTVPAFTNLTNDKFVIVWNKSCDDTEGTVGGEVTGGQNSNGVLQVTSIDTVDGSAVADNTFENGWKYVFHITIPTNETKLSMKFSDWLNTASANTIAAANNIRISSAQANNAGQTVLITAANTYSSPELVMTTDLDPVAPGIQVNVSVETKVPVNTVNGSYTTNYGVKSVQ